MAGVADISEDAFRYEVLKIDLWDILSKYTSRKVKKYLSKDREVLLKTPSRISNYRRNIGMKNYFVKMKSGLKRNMEDIEDIPDIVYIVVGFRIYDDSENAHKGTPMYRRSRHRSGHRKYPGSDLSYETLCEILYMKGFDPLYKIRNRVAKQYYTKIFKSKLVSYLRNHERISTTRIHIIADYVGKMMASAVMDYIWSSETPPLSPMTMKIRRAREKYGRANFPKGIEGSLVSTGQLASEVEYDSVFENTNRMRSFASFTINEMDREYKKLMSRSAKMDMTAKKIAEISRGHSQRKSARENVDEALKFSTSKRTFRSIGFKSGILRGISIPTTIPKRLDARLTEREYLAIRRFDAQMVALIGTILTKNEHVATRYTRLEFESGYAIAQRRMKEEILKLAQRTYKSDRELAAIDAAFDLIGAWGRPMNYGVFSNSDEDRHI